MKYAYPAVFTQEDAGYSVNFPDFESCYTSGETIEESLEMAEDVLCLTLYRMEEKGECVPKPSPVSSVAAGADEFVSLVLCDTLEYRKFYDSRAVKKTLTLPSWLNTMAEQAGINFSAALQSALKDRLGV